MLRPSRLRGAHRLLHRRRQGRHSSTILVSARPLSCSFSWSSPPSLLDRDHVRVHDTGLVDAHPPKHAHLAFARVCCLYSARPRTQHSLGHLRVRFCKDGPSRKVWLSSLGDSGLGPEIWSRRRARDLALLYFSCPFRPSQGGYSEPTAYGDNELDGKFRILRSSRLHARQSS